MRVFNDDFVLPGRDAIGIWNTGEVVINIKDESRFVLIEVPVNH